MNIDSQRGAPEQGKPTIFELILWLGHARMREQQLEAMAERGDLSREQKAKVATLLRKLRSEVRLLLERINTTENPPQRHEDTKKKIHRNRRHKVSMKDAKTALGQHIDPSKSRMLRVFLCNFVPFFAFLGVFVA